MSRIGVSLLLTAVLCPVFASAADETKPRTRPAGAAATGARDPAKMQEMMKRFDKNGDGQLDDSEKAAAKEAMQGLAGARKPGAPGAAGAGPRDPAKMQELIKKYDKNGDGKLDDAEKAEAKKAFGGGRPGAGKGTPGAGGDRLAEMIKRFDKNGDGKLDDAEKAAAQGARKKP